MSRVRLGALAAALAVAPLFAAGCGGDETAAAPTSPPTATRAETRFGAGQVEAMIARSLKPGLVANLGAGSTVHVACSRDLEWAYRCDAALHPGGKKAGAMHVIYGVDCDVSTCRWTPIG